MKEEFIPYEQALELKELGFNKECLGYYNIDPSLKYVPFNPMPPFEHEWCLPAPLYQQAFRWFREKYNFLYSIGKTNISVCHIPVANYHSTFMLQDNASYEMAELETIKAFIEHAKLIENG